MSRERRKDREPSFGLMDPASTVHLKAIIFMGMGNMCGKMEEDMLASGNLIRCTGKDVSRGAMGENMLERYLMQAKYSIKMILKMVSECFHGQMDVNMRVNGAMANSME